METRSEKEIGLFAKTAREHKGLTIEDISKKTGVSMEEIEALEDGDLSLPMEHLISVSFAVGIHPDNLIFSEL